MLEAASSSSATEAASHGVQTRGLRHARPYIRDVLGVKTTKISGVTRVGVTRDGN